MSNDGQEKKNVKVKRPTAQKREIQDAKKRLLNRSFRSEVRSAIKALRESVQQNNKDAQKAALSTVYSLVDKGVNKSIFKRNKASRIKARLTAYMHSKV